MSSHSNFKGIHTMAAHPLERQMGVCGVEQQLPMTLIVNGEFVAMVSGGNISDLNNKMSILQLYISRILFLKYVD